MRAATRARFFFLCALASVGSGCVAPTEEALDDQDPHAPGELIGLFSVRGRLGGDSCGADSLNAPTTWDFQVKLSREGSTLYWLNGREAIVGDIDRSGAFSFETTVDVPLSESRGGVKGCTVTRRDSAAGALPKGDALEGTLSYTYETPDGSDCSGLPLGSDGWPLALPCELRYELSGSRDRD